MRYAAGMVLVSAAVGLLSLPGRADEIDALIAQITRDADSDAARAARLVEAAKALEADGAAAVRILEKAVACAERSAADAAGLQAGLDALKALERKAPDRKAQWSRKRLDLCRLAYRAATNGTRPAVGVRLMRVLDELGERAAAAKDWATAAEAFSEAYRIASAIARRRLYFEARKANAEHFLQAEKKLQAFLRNAADRPDDARIHHLLLRTIVVDLDDPNEARRHLKAQSGQVYATYVPMAAGELGGLPETACAELRDWYDKSLAAQAAPVPKGRMLQRARAYGRRVLDLHTAKDAARLAAQTRLDRIDKELHELEPIPTMLRRLRYVDLTGLIDLDVDATAGAWTFVKGTFCCDTAKDARLRFPVRVTGGYRLSLLFAKTQRASDVDFTLPVGDHQVRLTMHEFYAPSSRHGASRGTASSAGRRLAPSRFGAENVTWLRLEFDGLARQRTASQAREINPGYERNKWVPYALEVAVRLTGDRVQMAATLNRQKWISWAGEKKGLAGRGGSSDGSIRVACPNPGLLIRDAKLRPVDGEVTFSKASRAESQPAGRDDESRPRWPFPRPDHGRR